MFSQLREKEKEKEKAPAKPSAPCNRRKNRKQASRFNTQVGDENILIISLRFLASQGRSGKNGEALKEGFYRVNGAHSSDKF